MANLINLERFKWNEWLSMLCLFFLMVEWLLPLPDLIGLTDLTPLAVCVGLSLLLDLRFRWRWYAAAAKLILLLFYLYSLSGGQFFSFQWISQWLSNYSTDISSLFTDRPAAFHPVTKHFLIVQIFLLFSTFCSYLVLAIRQSMLIVATTLLYLAGLNSAVAYPADTAVMRTVAVGLILLALTKVTHLERMASSFPSRSRTMGAVLLCASLIGTSILSVSYLAPKPGPAWQHLLTLGSDSSSSQGNPGGGGRGPVSKQTGFQLNNDNYLGGPLTEDKRVLFTAKVSELLYWRGDSKDIYTGRGWITSKEVPLAVLEPDEYQWDPSLFSGVAVREVKASVTFGEVQKYAIIFYPGQLKHISRFEPEGATMIFHRKKGLLETRNGVMDVFADNQVFKAPNSVALQMKQYDLVSEIPLVSEEMLQQAGEDYPEEIKQTYLQLPENLPERIRTLSRELTREAKTPYEKVMALQNHLRDSGLYQYEQKQVPPTGLNQDIVEQFLFESKKGYCDHFSTSMAVMLRSVGIPTRWVKGFTPGTVKSKDSDGFTVEVKNKNAHSWVEVYFSGIGWLPFEPTPSFPSLLHQRSDNRQWQTDSDAVPASSRPDIPVPEAEQDETSQSDVDAKDLPLYQNRAFYAWLGAGIVVLVFLLYVSSRMFQIWVLRRSVSSGLMLPYRVHFSLFLGYLQRLFVLRRDGQTLREFIRDLNVSDDQRKTLSQVTSTYEEMVYGERPLPDERLHQSGQAITRLSRELR